MSRPSRSIVNRWDLMSLDAAAGALDAAVSDLRDLTNRMADAPMRAGTRGGGSGTPNEAASPAPTLIEPRSTNWGPISPVAPQSCAILRLRSARIAPRL